MRKFFLLAVMATALFSCKKEALTEETISPTVTQSTAMTQTTGDLKYSLPVSRKSPCTTCTFSAQESLPQLQPDGRTLHTITVYWQSNTGSDKSIAFQPVGQITPSYQNVSGKSGYVPFSWYTTGIGIQGYDVISYTKRDMGGEQCQMLSVN